MQGGQKNDDGSKNPTKAFPRKKKLIAQVIEKPKENQKTRNTLLLLKD